MRKRFLIFAFVCFMIAIIISPLLSTDASSDLPIQNHNISSQINYSANEIETKDKTKVYLSKENINIQTLDMSAPKSNKTINANKINELENLKTTNKETNVETVETVKTNKTSLTKGEGNVLINFDKSAKNVSFVGKFRLTAYCPCAKCCDEYGVNRPTDKNGNVIVETATGANAYENRTIAVDPKVIPYGTIVVIEQDGVFYEYVAEDCGGAIENKKIDVFFNSHTTANEFGIKYGNVYLIED